MAAKKPSSPPKGGSQIYVVGPRGGPTTREAHTFRSSSSGQFVTRVMSNDAYKSASGKANTAIKEALRNSPMPQKKK